MPTLTKVTILAFALILASCGPPEEEIAMTMVAATAELENAVAVALQETQTAQPTQTVTHTATHTATVTATAQPSTCLLYTSDAADE